MKKVVGFFIAIVVLFSLNTGIAQARVISFLDDATHDLRGVAGDTSGWSSDDNVVSLEKKVWRLLGGNARIRAIGGDLSHRGTRGLGIWGGETDEIDSYGANPEKLVLTFKNPYKINSIQIRSLFNESDGVEKGRINFYLGGTKVFTQNLTGTLNGINNLDYTIPVVADRMVFFVPDGRAFSDFSEFSLARLNVTATPEPISATLFLLGSGALALRIHRKKKA